MFWSNWQGAIWRGAMLVVLFWSGLAWTQTQSPAPASDGAERIMVVHANGASTRCRVLQSWKTDDGRLAHLLQSVQTNEKITIVDEMASSNVPRSARGMPKRIFTWGVGNETSPEGAPIPPASRPGSSETLMAQVGIAAGASPMIVNAADKSEDATKNIEIAVDTEAKPQQMIDFKNLPPDAKAPLNIVNKQMKSAPIETTPVGRSLDKFGGQAKPVEIAQSKPIEPVLPKVEMPCQTCETTNPAIANRPPLFPRVNAMLTRPEPPLYVESSMPITPPGSGPIVHTPSPGELGSVNNPIVVNETPSHSRVVEPARRGWRPGDFLFGSSRTPVPVPIGSETRMADSRFLATENKIAEKRIADKTDKLPKAPFSTALSPDLRKSEPLAIASQSKDDKPATVAPPKEAPKTEKRDMWGLTTNDNAIPPGMPLSGTDVVKLPPPPVGRKDDPLASPERLLPNDIKSRGAIMAPVPTEPAGWPLGTQSVAAARSGLTNQVTYVPVPTITVPQPNHPPVPPPPAMPEAPQLNAYVNAFSPPPAPKPAAPNAGSLPQWMQPNPALMQHNQYQQQVMQQQMLQQQILMAHGYRPNPYAQPYMPSQGPMTNGSPQYAGPLPPQNPFMPPMTASYPPMMPMQPNAGMQQVSYQQVPTQQQIINHQVEQLIKVMRESPYPSQREMAAQSLTSFEWRVHPQIVPALLQAACQDPAASVRAGCVSCLCRMGAALEPVFGTLHSMRNDIDPRVRQEVEQTLGRLGQAAAAAQ